MVVARWVRTRVGRIVVLFIAHAHCSRSTRQAGLGFATVSNSIEHQVGGQHCSGRKCREFGIGLSPARAIGNSGTGCRLCPGHGGTWIGRGTESHLVVRSYCFHSVAGSQCGVRGGGNHRRHRDGTCRGIDIWFGGRTRTSRARIALDCQAIAPR